MNPRLIRALRPSRFVELWNAHRAFARPASVLRAYLGRGETFPLGIRTRPGSAFTVHDRHDAATAWMVWARREYPVPRGARCVFDLGANYGAFTLFAAEAAPDAAIVAVEPHPDALARLVRAVASNRLTDRTTCLGVAVAASDGHRWMSSDDHDAGPSRGIHPPGSTADRPHAVVPTTTLPHLLERALGEAGAEAIDLLKMDVEGAEHEIVPDLTRSTLAPVRAVAMEYHPNAPRAPLFAALESAGFRIVRDRVYGRDSGVAWFRRS
jgi:FkbM family methyltransferase